MAIVVKNNKITEEIVNEEGKQIGKIEYDPSDTKTYNDSRNNGNKEKNRRSTRNQNSN